MIPIVLMSLALAAQAATIAQLDAGRALEAKNDLPGALEAYQRAVAAAPGDAVARDRLGFVLGRLGRTGEALAAFAKAAELDPKLFDAQYHLGATRWWTHDLKGALEPLRTAVRLKPTHAEARYYFGLTLVQLDRRREGIPQLQRAIELNPALAPAQLQLGLALQREGDLDGALRHLQRAVRRLA
jgi:tetratricopeptide (TPR) repeat protein